MKIQHFYVNPAILLSGIWTINYFKHRDTTRRNYQPQTSPEFWHLAGLLRCLTGDVPVMFPWCSWWLRWEAGYLCSYLVCLPGISGCRGADTVKHVLTLRTHGLYATMTPQPQNSSITTAVVTIFTTHHHHHHLHDATQVNRKQHDARMEWIANPENSSL